MDRFYIIPNSAKDPELAFSGMIIKYLGTERGQMSCSADHREDGGALSLYRS